jgi:predicted PhzF superfamily epimerase YddE/YHI9
MLVPFYQVDAFAAERFRGNPAAVMVLPNFLDDTVLQAIAAENNLPETAFIVGCHDEFAVRWFTPVVEVPLCGHATLASAAVVMERMQPDRRRVVFQSASGPLVVNRVKEGYVLDFPVRTVRIIPCTPEIELALGATPVELADDGFNYIAQLASADVVRTFTPSMDLIRRLARTGLVITARGDGDFDMVSRYFAPAKGIDEDPVTGGAHCALTPYWAERLGKTELRAFQASVRGGQMTCRLRQDRVELEGRCVFFIEGMAEI